MKNRLIIFAIVGVLAAALFAVWPVAAQTETPPPGDSNEQNPAWGNGWGMHCRGAFRGGNGGPGFARGILHDAMISVFAQELGISVDDLNDRLASGETMAEIAESQGLTIEQFTDMMANAWDQAVEQALADGTITQEQADWMQQHRFHMTPGARRGQRRGPGIHGGCFVEGCPRYSQPAP